MMSCGHRRGRLRRLAGRADSRSALGRRNPRVLSFEGDDRQQDMRLVPGTAVQRDLFPKDLWRPIAGVVVLEGTDAGKDRSENP